MSARVSRVTMFAMVTWCLVAVGTRTAATQALCPRADVRGYEVEALRSPFTTAIEADLSALRGTPPAATWRMVSSDGIASDGLALEGVSLTTNTAPESGSNIHTFDVVVDLRASENLTADLKFVVVDGERTLRLGAIKGVTIGCQAMSVSRKLAISDDEFAAFFAAGRALRLRVERTTGVEGC